MKKETLLFKPVAPASGSLKTVLAFPNTYTVGITSLGYQTIWATLEQRKDVDVRRLFTDQGECPHRHLDLFGFSVSWELDAPKILNLLEQQHIPIWSNQRSNSSPIVFGGGPVLTANPEPLAPFFDVILLGDGEELLPNFINKMHEIKTFGRSEKLHELANIPGVYIPSLYKPIYESNGNLKRIEPISSKIPSSITKQTWKGESLSYSKVITPESAWPNIHMVEVVRSCPELCRFCLASYLTLPFRSPSLENSLIPAIEKGLSATKRLGLLGASVTQHPEFNNLIEWINQEKFNDIRLSVSSVRASTVTASMCKSLMKHGSKSITIAIESGSSRLRELINKKISEEEIFDAAKYALAGGLKGLKLYGMVGLPTEEENDIEATKELLIKLKKCNPGLRLTLGLSTFVPKAHTPFQWNGVRIESKNRIKNLGKQLKSKGIEFRPESYGWSVIQALISRSDRRLAPVIEAIRKTENTLGNWKKAYQENRKQVSQESPFHQEEMNKMPSWEEIIFETWDTSCVLPWTHLKGPLSNERLIEHRAESLREHPDQI